jgi:metallo-beta-lactamase family protein
MSTIGRSPTLTFLGGAGTVTGSKTLLDTEHGRLLVDCGLFQGRKELRKQNWSEFPVPPSSIDAVLLTHAHIDHCGYVPRLVRQGFTGPVYCTEGTRRLAKIVLPDSGHLHEEEAAYANRRGYSKHHPALPLYTEQDAVDSLRQFETVRFDEPCQVGAGVTATWQRAGHILGAASIRLRIDDTGEEIVFSGDLGRRDHPLFLPPADVVRADVLIVESTYGDEVRPEADAAEVIALAVDRAVERSGAVLVPAFAVDRTEVVLWHLDRLVASGRIPSVPIYVDSPMALRALEVYRSEARGGSPEIRPELHGVELFPSLAMTEAHTADESKALNAIQGPMIIVSASGMATGGRVIHHLANRLGDDRNTVLLVGFQAPGTRGASLRDGVRQLKMLGKYFPVRARIMSATLSSHADQAGLIDWVGTASPKPGVVYVNHGEPVGSAALADALDDQLDLCAVVARPGERVRI